MLLIFLNYRSLGRREINKDVDTYNYSSGVYISAFVVNTGIQIIYTYYIIYYINRSTLFFKYELPVWTLYLNSLAVLLLHTINGITDSSEQQISSFKSLPYARQIVRRNPLFSGSWYSYRYNIAGVVGVFLGRKQLETIYPTDRPLLKQHTSSINRILWAVSSRRTKWPKHLNHRRFRSVDSHSASSHWSLISS